MKSRYYTGCKDRNNRRVFLGNSTRFVSQPGTSFPIDEGEVLKPFVSKEGNIVVKAFSMTLAEIPSHSYEVVDDKKDEK